MKILQIIDSLQAGGAERVAVNYANAIAAQGDESFLWATRLEGNLKLELSEKVHYVFLNRKGIIGFRVLWKGIRFLKKHQIEIIHAHGSSYFFGALLKICYPEAKLVWHDHYGFRHKTAPNKNRILKFCSRFFDAVFVVNPLLEIWANEQLYCKKAFYIQNFIATAYSEETVKIQGDAEINLVCLANFRSQKDHINLLKAFELVLKNHPRPISLHLVGKYWEDTCKEEILAYIRKANLEKAVFVYGSQTSVLGILKQMQMGILSSSSEGFPLALLEYGLAAIPVVSTDVGFCKEMLNQFGISVPPNDPEALSEAILFYIENKDLASKDAQKFNQHVLKTYTRQSVMPAVYSIYRSL